MRKNRADSATGPLTTAMAKTVVTFCKMDTHSIQLITATLGVEPDQRLNEASGDDIAAWALDRVIERGLHGRFVALVNRRASELASMEGCS